MKVSCPLCSAGISSDQLNVEKDIACCVSCDEVFAISAMVAGGQGLEDFDFSDMPKGAWFTENFDGWTIGVTSRSPIAFFLVPFACIWTGMTVWMHFGSQIGDGDFEIEETLFAIPFVLAAFVVSAMATMAVFGKVVVTVENGLGRLFMGVGSIGWTRKFDWAAVNRIVEDKVSGSDGRQSTTIVLEGKSRLKFGSMLSESRRFFMLQGLRKLLASRSL